MVDVRALAYLNSTLPKPRDAKRISTRDDFSITSRKSTELLEGTKVKSEQLIGDEDGSLLRDKVRVRERWSVFSHKWLKTTKLKLDPTNIDLLTPRPLKLSLGHEPSIDITLKALKGMLNLNEVGQYAPPAERIEVYYPLCSQCFHSILIYVWVTAASPSNGEMRGVPTESRTQHNIFFPRGG